MFLNFRIVSHQADGILLALHETARITAVIFAIIAMATFLRVVLTYSQAPQKIISYFTEIGGTPLAFWFAVAVICLISPHSIPPASLVPVTSRVNRTHREHMMQRSE